MAHPKNIIEYHRSEKFQKYIKILKHIHVVDLGKKVTLLLCILFNKREVGLVTGTLI